ncbi:MAG: U32 family peptidase [Butyrivibrio sp.]|nr:U32 family peptidase [Butyrivibrio sp.]
MKKVELLSPAGGFETMVGAFNAGADAVYLGGSKFGARAYADNFDTDEVLDAIVYAHLHDKKIYMTVNTLIKEKEFGELYNFMLPYAEKGLDGVIVQDFGVMRLIGREFPEIELHASTQQTVTGVYGARLLKDLGCCRVVPARELSLEEMKAIRDEAGVEVEAFIHGAMCYCYSGACLFSSMVGVRSGNRGRCAQPCRLPYRFNDRSGSEQYPLSLKDMSTIGIIPELIEAGIDSFKIEGRMKKPEYSAGVTALYRKYIDRYYAAPDARFTVSKEDIEILRNLYQRTGISEGYYHRHNDRSMVTITSPAYNKSSEDVLLGVADRYLSKRLKVKCDISCRLKVGCRAELTIKALRSGDEISAEVFGNEVQRASKRPMEIRDVEKQLKKLGNTGFEPGNISVDIDDGGLGCGIFISVGELNDLRRRACDELESLLTGGKKEFSGPARDDIAAIKDSYKKENLEKKSGKKLHILVSSREQLSSVLSKAQDERLIDRIYIDSNVFLSMDESEKRKVFSCAGKDTKIIIALPYVTRREAFDGTDEIRRVIKEIRYFERGGVLVRNLEQLGFLRSVRYGGALILDAGIYTWNREAVFEFLSCNLQRDDFFVDEFTASYELSFREAKEIAGAVKSDICIPVSYHIYGRVPMMISAGCVKKTMDKCSGRRGELYSEEVLLFDRMNNRLPVTINCRNCSNIIWNAHPTSLHAQLDRILESEEFDHLRIDFTTEDEKRTQEVLGYYVDRLKGMSPQDIFGDEAFTTGHFKREAE